MKNCTAYRWFLRVSVLCLLVFLPRLFMAQEQQLRNYTVKDGLASTEVYDIFQDSKGYMWFATDAGVSRFDGYRFVSYNTTDGLPDNTIFGFYEDHRGRIWFRSYNGKLSYYQDGRIITLHQLNKAIARHLVNNYALSIYVDPADTLWVGFNKNMELKVSLTSAPLNPLITRHDKRLHHIFPHDQHNFMHAGSDEHRIMLKMPTGTRTLNFPLEDTITFFSSAVRVAQDHEGNFLIGYRDYIARASAAGDKFKRLYRHIIFVDEDRENNIWLGYAKNGVDLFPGGDLNAVPLHFLSNYSVTNVCQDKEGAYWFATMNNGVFYMGTRFIRNYPLPGLGRVQAIDLLDDTTLIAALFNGKVLVLNTRNESIRLIETGMPYLRDMARLRSGSMFVLGYSGLKEFMWPAAKFGFRRVNGCRNMIAESDSVLTLATTEAGIARYNVNSFYYSEVDLGSFREQVYAMGYDHKGKLWLGTPNGLFCYSGKKIVAHTEKHPLLKSRFSGILEPVPGQLWMSSLGAGVVIYEPATGKVKQLSTRQGLPHPLCNSLCKDADGSIWVSTNRGISRIIYNHHDGKFAIHNLDYVSGLLTNEVRCAIRSGNKLWVGTAEGLSVVDIQQLKPNRTPPSVYIRSVSVFNKQMDARDVYRLPFDSNTVTIRFTGLSFRRPGEMRYKIKMTGIDSSWKYTDQPEIQYSTLPPGEYTFMVYALNENNVPSLQPAQLHFSIATQYWQQAWFRLSVALAVLGFLIFILNLRHHNQQRITRERMKSTEMELRALHAQMNPHFIFNALASIQHFILSKEVSEANKYLGKFSRLIRNVLNNSRKEMIQIGEEIKTLELYLDLERLRTSGKFTYIIKVDPSLDPDHTLIPSMLIQPFAENAIWHGLLSKSEEGHLSIELLADHEKSILKAIIEDDGIGRTNSAKIQAVNNKQHRSLGITVTRQRLENYQARYNVHGRLEIMDLKKTDGSAAGTRVIVEFPMVTEYAGTE